MKRVAFVVILFIIGLFAPQPSFAVCRVLPPGQTCSTVQFPRTYALNDGGSPQCTAGTNNTYNVCCDFESEANAADSVRAPICGSSQELGKANSSCWTCGGDLRCAGLDLGLKRSDTSPELFNKLAISPTDTIEDMDRVWRVNTGENFPETFRFNGIEYNRNGRGIVMCRSNVLGCGASDLPPGEQCKSALFPNENITDKVTDNPNAGNAAAPATVIDGRPGRTRFTMETSETITLGSAITSFWSTIINWVFHFPVIDGRVKTAESDLTPLMKTVLGTLDGRYDNEGALTGSQKGGKLLPLALQKTLSWPQEKTTDVTNYVKDWIVGRDCGWLGGNVDLEGKVNPDMAVTENLKDTYPTTLGGFVIWDALLAPHKTNGQPGIPSTNMTIDPGPPIGSVDESSGKTKLNESFLGEVYRCQSQSSSRQTTRRFFDIFGFLGFGESEGSGWNAKLPVDAGSIFKCGNEENPLFCIAFHKVKTFTKWLNGGPALTSAIAGMEKDEKPEGVAPDLVEKLRTDYAGAGNTFLPQVKIEESKVRYYNRLGHSSTTLEGASSPTFGGQVKPELPHHAVKRTIDRFTEMMCMIFPLSKQTDECAKVFDFYNSIAGELNPNTSDWALPGASMTPISTAVTIDNTDVKTAIAAATKDRIPACVLEAVKYIETGSNWSAPAECKINTCSAAGPFQITVGVDGTGSKKCEKCGDSYADGSRTCPDAWPHNWPGNPDQSPCNVSLAANAAVNLLLAKSQYWTSDKGLGHALDTTDPRTQQPGIILAGNSYYGSSAPIGRLGNCSYGEFVYKNCDASYVCGSGGNIDF